MTPEELQAEIDKIMRMAVRLEPVDLRYDVNKDGQVSEADAYLVNSGAATIPPVTTTPPPTTTATVTTTLAPTTTLTPTTTPPPTTPIPRTASGVALSRIKEEFDAIYDDQTLTGPQKAIKVQQLANTNKYSNADIAQALGVTEDILGTFLNQKQSDWAKTTVKFNPTTKEYEVTPASRGGEEMYVNPVTGKYVSPIDYLFTANTPEAIQYRANNSSLINFINNTGLDYRAGQNLFDTVQSYNDFVSGADLTEALRNHLGQQLKNQGINSFTQIEKRVVNGEDKYYNKTTGREINPVLFDDKAGTKYLLTDQGIQKQFDPISTVAAQLAQYVDPKSTGGAWAASGYGPRGMLEQLAQRLINKTGITNLNDMVIDTKSFPLTVPVLRYDDEYGATWYKVLGRDVETGNPSQIEPLTPEELRNVKVEGSWDPELGSRTYYFLDTTENITGIYNKNTGALITGSKFIDLDGWAAGEGWTSGILRFDNDNKPRVTTYGADSGDLKKILPAIAILSLPFTLGASSALLSGEAALLAAESGIAAGGLGVAGAGYGAAASGLAGLGSSLTSQLTSALPAELVSAGQTLASTFNTVRPYLQGANALYQASQGNIAGAISSGLGAAGGFGVPGAAEAARIFNIGYGATQGNYLPVVQELLNQSGAGGALANTKIAGDFTVSDAFKGASFLQALQSENPTIILNAAAALTGSQDLRVAAAANNFVNILNNPNATAFDIAMGANRIAGALNTASNQPPPNNAASHAQNLPRSNTAIGAVAVDDKGELYIMDDDGNRTSLTGVDAGRVYTPTEWNSIQAALSAGQAQYVNGLINAMNSGSMNSEEVAEDLHLSGFNDATIAKIFDANEQYIYRSNQAQKLVTDYTAVGSDLSRESALERLRSLGFDEADANTYISNIDKQVTARNNYVNVSRDFVANNLGTSEQAITKLRDSLANVGVTGDQQDKVVDAYNKMRLQAAGADLTPSEMTNLAVLAANKTNWVALPGKSGHEVAFALTDEGDPYVVAARDKDGNNLLNVYQNLTPQGVMQVVNAQLAQARADEQTKGAPNQYVVDKEISDAASAAGLVRTTGMIRNNFSTVNTDYFNNLLRQYSAMSPEDRAKIASASGVTIDLRVLKDIDAQYKAIDQQYAAAVANNSPLAKLYKSLDTRVENKAGYYYTNNGVQPSTAMAMAVQDLQGGNLFNRVNLSEVQDSKFPFETKEFINQFRGTPAGDTLANVLSSAYAVAGSAAANTLNGSLGINLHIAEALGMDAFANDFRKLATGIKTAGDDAIAIANASTDAHKNLIGGLSNVVSAIPWLATGVAPGIVAGAMATTYGNEYIQGRLAGQSIDDAGKRATLMAIAEGIGERIGADEAVRLLKPLWRTTPTDQLGKVIGDSLVNQIGKYGTKEQLGELLSYSLQAGVDKTPQIGLAQDMTGMEFIKGALDTIQQTFVAAGANSGLAVGLRGNMTQDNSGSIKVISPDGSQGLVELGNGSVIRVDIPEGLDLKVGEDININALMHDAVYVPDNVNERFNTLESQLKDIYQTELGRPPTFAELDFNVKRLADGTDIQTVANELNNSQAGQLLDQRNTFNAQTDQQIAANAKSLLDQGRTTYAEFKDFMNTMGLASDRQLNVLDTITPRANVAGTVTSIIGDNAVVTGTDGQMYTMLRVAPNNYLIQVGDQVNLGVSTVKPDATPTVEVTTKIADVIAASVSTSTSLSISQSISQAAISTSISNSQSVSTSLSQSESISVSAATSISESVSQSVSLSQSVSTADMERAISISNSVSQSLSVSQAISLSASISEATSLSVSNSQSVSTSISQATSVSEALSLSVSISEQIEKDRLKGLSISASVSESVSKAVSISESVSVATSISESTSASISNSQSVSVAASISESVSFSTSQSTSVSQALSTQASISEAVSISVAASTSQSISVSQEVSKQVSISQSTSQSISLSQSLSQSQAVSVSASVSESVSESVSTSLSLSQSTSASLSSSIAQSLSLSQKMSEDIVRGLSISASLSASESVSQSVSRLVSASISTSQSASTSLSLSESISKATQLSISNSLSASASVSQSQSLSASQSVSKALSESVSQSLSLSESVAQSISQSLSLSAFQSQSLSVSEQIERDRAVGISISNSLSQSVSLEASKSQSISISTSTQQSISNAVSLSESVSISTYLSQEVSRQTSLSQSLSTANSLSLSLSQSQSLSQSLSQAQTVSITPSITQTVSVTETIAPTATVAPSVTESITQTVTQSVTESITEVITQSLTEALTPSLTATITQLPTLAPTITASATIAPSISVTETFTQTPSLTMVITTTSLPPVTTTITIPPVTTSELVTTEQVTTITIPPVTPPPTSGTIPPVTTPSISVPDQTTTAPITTLPVTTAPITTAVTTARPPTTTARPPTTTARPPTTTARPGGLPFPIFGIPAATGQQTTYIDYAQPKVPAPEFGPYDLFKAPSYLRPLQDSGNFGLAALIGAASESQQRNGDNQSQQNAESQGQAPTG